VALRIDERDVEHPEVIVDCAARMHICHAVCCKLDFALSAEEVERGAVRWDLGRPYFIRHGSSGHCVHNDRETGACGVYDDRPAPCRHYSCATDTRIWSDFDRMELNDTWLSTHMAPAVPSLLHAMLQSTSD
jgi:Fe-S-cluster containining protein